MQVLTPFTGLPRVELYYYSGVQLNTGIEY